MTDFIKDFYSRLPNINLKKNNFSGIIITIIHSILPFLIALVLLFSNDIITLFLLLFILNLILFSNYKCSDCPISFIEDKYKGPGFANTCGKFMFGKNYDFSSRSQLTKELIWIGILLTFIKICGILILKSIKPYLNHI